MTDQHHRPPRVALAGELDDQVQVVGHPVEVVDERALPGRLPVAEVVGPVDRRAAIDEDGRHVLVATHVLAVAVGQHDDALGITPVPHRDAQVALAALDRHAVVH